MSLEFHFSLFMVSLSDMGILLSSELITQRDNSQSQVVVDDKDISIDIRWGYDFYK